MPKATLQEALEILREVGKRNSGSDQQIIQTIHDHAAALGASCQEPDADESSTWKPQGVLLVEGATFETGIWPQLQESATTDYPIKLISPGRGSSGYYGPDVLRKAAESKIFKAGTQMFWNHDTDAEEGARPEGDLNRLAAVTTTDATWQENGHDGPGLYARAKVFADYADKVKEKGPHIGLSIRAGGERDEAARAPDGKPRVITALKNAQSVDFVTKAGRDGKIFTESAAVAESQQEKKAMDKAEIQALLKESLAPIETKLTEAQAENKKLREQLARSEGPRLIRESLADIRLPEAGKAEVIRRLLNEGIPDDMKALKEAVERSAKDVADFLREAGYGQNVAGFGARLDPKQLQEAGEAGQKAHAEALDESLNAMAKLFVGDGKEHKAGRKAFREGRAA